MADQTLKHLLLRIVSGAASLIWWLLLAVVVLLALYAGIGRQVTQNINEYRSSIEQRLSSELGQPVSIGGLSSSWNWLDPTIVARDIVVVSESDRSDVVGSLKSVRIGLDFLASLMRLRIVFADFNADGLELTINQTPRGAVTVEGVDIPDPVANDLELWLDIAGEWLSDPSVKITRLDLGIRDANGTLRHVEVPQLDLIYRRGLFHASGRAMRPGTTEQLASFELVGRHFFRGDFTGQVYADINSGRLFDGLAEEYAWRNIRAEGFDLGGQVWMTFRDGRIEQVSGNLETPYLQPGVGHQSLAPLENIRAKFGWRRHDTLGEHEPEAAAKPWYATGEFHVKELEWEWNGNTVSPFSLRFSHRDGGRRLIADALSLQPLRQLAVGMNLLPGRAERALENYRPTGRLDRVMLNLPADDSDGFELTAALNNLGVRAHDGAPGVSGLDGTLLVNPEGGFVRVNSEELSLGFPELFRGDWGLRDVSAGVAWRFEGGVTRVYADDIRMVYGANTRLTGAFDLRMDQGGEDNLGLKVGVRDGTADMLADFVPVKVVEPDLYEWLTTAITRADISSGEFYGHGQIDRDAPENSFSSSMVYRFEEASIRYDERWPEVADASGEVFIQDGRTRVDIRSGRTGGLELEPSEVRVVPEGEDIQVYVDASAPVPGSALAFWMDNSPLGELAGEAGRSIILDGDFHLELGLGLPLVSDAPPTINARVRADSGTLTYPEADLQWTQVNGQLAFTSDKGFSENPLQARFMGAPVTVLMRRSENDQSLNIRQYGRLDVRQLLDRTELPEGTGMGLSGDIGYQATLDVSPDTASAVTLYSDLAGLSVDWPAPLAKDIDAEAPLRVTVTPRQQSGLDLSVDWQDRADLNLTWQAGMVDIALNELFLGDRQLTDITVSARQSDSEWLITTDSEWASGSVIWPRDDRPVNVDLERLTLHRSDNEADEGQEPEQAQAFRDLDIGNWPDVDVRIAALNMDGENAGSWSFQLRPEATQLLVQDIVGTLKSLTLTGELAWSIAAGREITRFTGDINGKSLADLDTLVGAEIPFRSKNTAVKLDVDWPGRPDQFDVSGLSGSVSVRFDDGVILEGNNTAQLFRVFNLLNADTLWRRLKLDFSDLYEAGVAFDAISGKASMINGLLTLDPELQVVGPSGAFKLTGTSNMIEETLDMRMVVVLPLTQNLPLAALLMGAGAPIGGALFVLDKVLGDPLSKLTSATYSVSGSWDEPDVRLRRVFDTGN
ncbi:AsmA-like C-terminal region-containing protein [uncultured Marinobacter sp.]|uniref:YhdP family phospholipid transporter n=2 Tax=uncultured Marinobacter sp. TaxID=187379 RepID=UPI0025833600|nr:AsmA-like C-terminal region-containing protein [uncultured Marinobacter sp.]